MDNPLDAPPGPDDPPRPTGGVFPGSGALTWSPHRALLGGLAVGVISAVGWALLSAGGTDRLVAWALAGAAAIVLLSLARRRLRGGPDGFEVRRLGGTRQVGWEAVRSVREVDARRAGRAGRTVEIDLADDTLLVFGRTELGADPEAVGGRLRAWWHRAGEPDPD